MENPIKFAYDGDTEIFTVYGVQFTLDVFKVFAWPKEGHAYTFKRKDETLIIIDLGPYDLEPYDKNNCR